MEAMDASLKRREEGRGDPELVSSEQKFSSFGSELDSPTVSQALNTAQKCFWGTCPGFACNGRSCLYGMASAHHDCWLGQG